MVGVIANKFHKVLVYICVQVAYAWKLEENAAHKQGDTSSIRGNTFSTNQTRSRGSTGPPEHPNQLKTGPYPHRWHGGPPSSLLTKNGTDRAQPTVGRPWKSADHVSAAHRPHRLSVYTWQRVVGPPWRFGSILEQIAGGSPLYIYEGRWFKWRHNISLTTKCRASLAFV